MTYTIHESKNDQSRGRVRINPAIAVDKARVLELLGWQVHVTDSSGHLFAPLDFDRLFIVCLRERVANPIPGSVMLFRWFRSKGVRAIATRVFAWFLGSNDLSTALVDPETGSCLDGLHPDRANENRGGESVLAYLLSLAEIRQLARSNIELAEPLPLRAVGA